MRKLLTLSAAVATAALIGTGCKTNIAELPITERDQQVYNNPYLKNNDKQQSGKVRVAVIPQNVKLPKGFTSETNKNMCDALENAISNLKDFEAVPRTEISALLGDKQQASLSGDVDNYKIADTDYVLVFRISDITMEKINSMSGMISAVSNGGMDGKYKAKIRSKFTLIDSDENRKAFTKTITAESDSCSSHKEIDRSKDEVNQAIDNTVKEFVTQFAVDYAPPAVVLQTKGSGQVAMINIGKDFGLMKNMKIEFFKVLEKRGRKQQIPFAYGKVLEVDTDSAWVEVDNYEDAGVKENNFARVRRDQSKSFLEKATE